MLRELFPWLILFFLAAVIYFFRERHRIRTRVRPRRPDFTVLEAWDSWGAGRHPDTAFMPAGLDPVSLPEQVQAAAKQSLLELEGKLEDEQNPRLEVRRVILRNAAVALHLGAMAGLAETERTALIRGYQAGMDELLRDAVRIASLQWIVLRHYTRMKYDDAVPSDWFHRFLYLAGPYIGEKVRLGREFVLEMNEGAAQFAQVYDQLLKDLQKELLQTPPKRRFVPPDLPGGTPKPGPV